MIEKTAATPAEMEALGAFLAGHIHDARLVGLQGELGAGKTTLVRGFLRALGHEGVVRSPTFTLVESYKLHGREIHHFDLYRVNDPEELEFLGVRDYLKEQSTCLVEWPERGAGVLPVADIDVIIHATNQRRTVRIVSHTEQGAAVLDGLK